MHGVTETCPECQFDPTSCTDADFADRFATFAKRYPIPLTRLLPSDTPAVLTTKPDESTWSAMEYVGHAAQLFEEFVTWLPHIVADDGEQLHGADVDAAVRDARFNDDTAADLAARVAAAGTAASEGVRALTHDQLHRVVTFEQFTVPFRMLVIAWIHEGHHHLLDVGRVLRTVRSTSA